MTYKRNNTAKKPDPRTPTFHAYSVRPAKEEDGKGFWTKIGVFFPHEDGQGGTLVLDALPIGDRIVLRAPSDDA